MVKGAQARLALLDGIPSFETCRVQLTTRRNHRPAERTLDRRFNDDDVCEIWGEVEVSESRWRQRQLL